MLKNPLASMIRARPVLITTASMRPWTAFAFAVAVALALAVALAVALAPDCCVCCGAAAVPPSEAAVFTALDQEAKAAFWAAENRSGVVVAVFPVLPMLVFPALLGLGIVGGSTGGSTIGGSVARRAAKTPIGTPIGTPTGTVPRGALSRWD